jgi:hypothetical protein
VTSRHSSEKNNELAARQPRIAKDLAHWTEAVFMIVNAGAHALAVNLARPLTALDSKSSRLWHARFQPAVGMGV